MKQVLIKQGQIVVEEVPRPLVEAGTVLVRCHHSCISVGTELSGVRSSAAPLWKRALQNPGAVYKVLEMAAMQGIAHTTSVVQGALAAGQPTGYSTAGVVVEVGPGVTDLFPGDRVACAGAQQAHHAEWVRVSRNLVVRMPDGIDFPEASTVTLGAIALQGVRRGSPTLGETFLVIGLGLLGQLTVQLLKANGCRVIGIDLDPQRVALAKQHGLDLAIDPQQPLPIEQAIRLTDGVGADGVIITASTPSDEVVSQAFQMCRKKGRVVLVGDVGLNLKRADFYAKEIDFFISTSYGPGRYDKRYEEEGLDYPVSYVRWTENRNLSEYLRLVAERKVRVEGLISRIFPVDEADAAYRHLQESENGSKPLMVLLEYPDDGTDRSQATLVQNTLARRPTTARKGTDPIRLALAGGGGFAKGMHLPNLQTLATDFKLHAVMSRSGPNAVAIARQYGAGYSTSDYDELLADPQLEAVLICTRHHQHGDMMLRGLQAGKHVLVEKPLTLEVADLDRLQQFVASLPQGQSPPLLMTGYNRRFSPHWQRVAELIRQRTGPFILNYRMNAGFLPHDHWTHGPEGGGRNLGEACHIYDLFVFLTQSTPVALTAHAIRPQKGPYQSRDNFVATVTFAEGSVATLTYTALGSGDHPKEQAELFCDGKVVVMNDYRETRFVGAAVAPVVTRAPEKGHREELKAFALTLRGDAAPPMSLAEQLTVARIAFEVDRQLAGTPM